MLKLAPFALAQAVYWTRDPELRITSPLIKCTPILCLVLYLILKRDKWSSRGQGSDPKKVLLGLIFRYIYNICSIPTKKELHERHWVWRNMIPNIIDWVCIYTFFQCDGRFVSLMGLPKCWREWGILCVRDGGIWSGPHFLRISLRFRH